MNLLVVDTEGMSVLTGWAAGKFSGAKVAAAVKASGLKDQEGKHRIIIPGYVAQISGEVEEGLPGWEVLVGPGEASDIGSFMKIQAARSMLCHRFASSPLTSLPRCQRERSFMKRRCGRAYWIWSCRAGGEGSCGLCQVDVVGREVPVLACQTKITSDIEVRLPDRSRTGALVLGDSHALIEPGLLPSRDHLTPLYRRQRLVVPPASIEEHYSDWTRLTRELSRHGAPSPITGGIGILRELAEALRYIIGLMKEEAFEDKKNVMHITKRLMEILMIRS